MSFNPQYVIAGAFGGGVGASELFSRYRDAPSRLIQIPAAWIYVILNALSSLGALFLIHYVGWTFGQSSTALRTLYQVLVASFGSVAFFRSSLFSLQIGGSTVDVGPSALLSAFLSSANRGVDRDQARQRIDRVAKAMTNIDYVRSHIALPTECFAASVNTSPADQQTFRAAIALLDAQNDMSDVAKCQVLGIQLLNLIGFDVLNAAISALGPEIKFP